ncbi:MAG: hypothetical protein IJQ39_06365 [Thermoguttaceae bacterium]|nr:hypothetical protein [Thermoguttaceae bacterium]
MREPRLRTVQKVQAPYKLNEFPASFIDTFAREIVYMRATKATMSIEGAEWEQVFANCIGAQWKPSNVGLDDVVLGNCCWGAKTVKGGNNVAKVQRVRLISGRNSPTFSFGEDRLISQDPNDIGKMVLAIWNERVSAVREIYKFVRTVVLVKSNDYNDYLIFEEDTTRYDSELYNFVWNNHNNLEGYSKKDKRHCFTWQPSGSQFTIIVSVPSNRLYIRIREPEPLAKEDVLKALKFDNTWYSIVE